jgi:hypothetical protein
VRVSAALDGCGDDSGVGWVGLERVCVGLICAGAGPESLSGLERVGHDLDPSHGAAYVTIHCQV